MADQAAPLETEALAAASAGKPVIWAVASGKGGVGKSFIVSNLGLALAQGGHRVIVVDLDLGGANLHTHLGMRQPKFTLSHFLDGREETLANLCEPLPEASISMISGASDHHEIANLKYFQKQKLIRHLSRLDADHVILDLGAGTTFNTLDFFNVADHGIMVVVPEPTSIENGYRFLRSAMKRRLMRLSAETGAQVSSLLAEREEGGSLRELVGELCKRHPKHGAQMRQRMRGGNLHLVVNQVREPADFQLGYSMALVWKHYSGRKPDSLSFLNYDEAVIKGLREHKRYLSSNPNSRNSVHFRHLARTLVEAVGDVRS